MRTFKNGIIGGSGSNNGEEPTPETLAPCPCGEDAIWYRAEEPSSAAAASEPRRSVGAATYGADDEAPPNLCEGCFPHAVPPAQQVLWKRVEARRRSRTGEDDQTRGGRVWKD
jgi:hypothetical protein